ncbi:hypothetical protein D3C81_1947260 [compost metagenome]
MVAIGRTSAADHEKATRQIRDGAEQTDFAVTADTGTVDQRRHPERQGIDRQHHREIHRH